MHAEVDGGDTMGVTDLEHVPASLMDGVGVGVLENSRSCLFPVAATLSQLALLS